MQGKRSPLAWRLANIVALVGMAAVMSACRRAAAPANPRTPAPQPEKKTVNIKVLLPKDDATVSIDGEKKEGDKAERTYRHTTTKDTVEILASFKPNGYTTIRRTKKLAVKDEIVADLREKDPKNP